jgi:polynucleotide 5'-kinase involved in rRNA processing
MNISYNRYINYFRKVDINCKSINILILYEFLGSTLNESNSNKVLKRIKNIGILSSYYVDNFIWNQNSKFVTLKKLHRNFKKSIFYNGKKALTGF